MAFDRAKEEREQAAWARMVSCPCCMRDRTKTPDCTACKGLGLVDPEQRIDTRLIPRTGLD